MMRRWVWLLLLFAAQPCFGQTLDELKQRLTEREAEVQQLREQIQTLEQQTVAAIPMSPAPASTTPADEAEDIDRALERALVREGGLLLSPGTAEAELNFSYSHASRESIGFRRDAFGPGLTLRVGLPLDSQLSVGVPYVFENRASVAGSNSGSGIGDVSFALSHQFVFERDGVPNLIGALGYRLPTGRNTLFTSGEPVAFGSGFNALQASLTATKRSDPLVLFGSYGYTHNFDDRKGTQTVDVGDTHGLRLGALLAASASTSLRVAFDLLFFERVRFDGVGVTDSPEPAGMIEVGGSFLIGDRSLLDVAIGAGLTSTAPDFRVTGAFPVRF